MNTLLKNASEWTDFRERTIKCYPFSIIDQSTPDSYPCTVLAIDDAGFLTFYFTYPKDFAPAPPTRLLDIYDRHANEPKFNGWQQQSYLMNQLSTSEVTVVVMPALHHKEYTTEQARAVEKAITTCTVTISNALENKPIPEPKRVAYVIVSGKYEQVIHGIFSTREKAEAALPHVRPNDDGIGWCGPDIEEWPLNPTTQELR